METPVTWSTPKTVLTIDHNERFFSVPGKAGKRCTVAIKNLRLVISEDFFASSVHSAMDEIDESNDSTIECLDIRIDLNNKVNVSDETNVAQPYDAEFLELSIAELSSNYSDSMSKENKPASSTVNRDDRIKIFLARRCPTLFRNGWSLEP